MFSLSSQVGLGKCVSAEEMIKQSKCHLLRSRVGDVDVVQLIASDGDPHSGLVKGGISEPRTGWMVRLIVESNDLRTLSEHPRIGGWVLHLVLIRGCHLAAQRLGLSSQLAVEQNIS